MKIQKRVFLVLFLTIILLVVSAFPAAADAEKIVVYGTCELLAFAPFGIDPDPDYRYWTNPNNELFEHWRYQVILFYCDYISNADRLDGYLYAVDNWNVNPNETSNFMSQTFSKGFVSDEFGNDLNLWEISGSGSYDSNWNFSEKFVFRGVGENQGLLAKLNMTGSWPLYFVEGELLVPANK